MAGEIASAFVRIRPNMAGFKGEVESGTKGAFGGLGKVLGATFAIGGIAEATAHVASAAAQQQADLAAVKKSVENVNAAWTVNGKTVTTVLEDMARKSGTSVPELAQGFIRLETATGNSAKSLKDLHLVEDVSIARHLGLAQAALAVSKAEQGQSTGLRRLGIIVPPVTTAVDALTASHAKAETQIKAITQRVEEMRASGVKFSASQTAQISLAKQQILAQAGVSKVMLEHAKALDQAATRTKVLDELQRRFGGQTAVFAETAAGKYAIFKESLRQLEVSIGNQLLPALSSAAGGLATWTQALEHSKTLHDAIAGAIGTVGTAYHTLAGILGVVAPLFVKVAGAAAQVVKLIGPGPILIGIAAYKAYGIALNLVALAERRWAAFIALGQPAKEAEITETQALTVALTENTAALQAYAAAMTGTIAETEAFGAAQAGVATELDAIGASAAGTAVEVEAAGAASVTAGAEAATAAIGFDAIAASLAAIATGPVGIGIAIAGLAIAFTHLSGGMLSAEGDAKNLATATDHLAGSLRGARGASEGLQQALNALPTDKIARDSAKLQANEQLAAIAHLKHGAALAALGHEVIAGTEPLAKFVAQLERTKTSTKGEADELLNAGSAVSAFVQSQRTVVSDQQKVEAGHKAVAAAADKVTSAYYRQNAAAQKIASDEEGITQFRNTQIQAQLRIQDAAASAQTRSLIETQSRTQQAGVAAQRFADDIGKAISQEKQHIPILDANQRKLAEFAQAVGHIPTPREIRLILHNEDANKSLADFITQFHESLAQGAAAAASGGDKIFAALAASLGVASQGAALQALEQGGKIGDAMIQGIVNALGVGIPSLAAAGAKAADSATSGAKGGIRAHSPSQVWRDEVGKSMIDGAVAGVVQTTGNLVAASVTAVVNASTAAGLEAGKISGVTLGLPLLQGVLTTIEAGLPNLKAGITQTFGDAVKSARQSIVDSVAQGESSLNAIGGSIGQQLGAFIDAKLKTELDRLDTSGNEFGVRLLGIAKRVVSINVQLAAEQAKVSLQGAQDSIKSARQALADVVSQGAQSGETPAQFAARLQAARKAVTDANRSLRDVQLQQEEAALQKQIDRRKARLQQAADKEKQNDAKRLADLTDRFNKGLISEGQLQAGVQKVIGGSGATFTAMGKLMGIAFVDQFKAELLGLREQAGALVPVRGKVPVPGLGFEPNIVRPLDAIRAAIINIGQQQVSELKKLNAEQKKSHKGGKKKHGKGSSGTKATSADVAAAIGAGAKR